MEVTSSDKARQLGEGLALLQQATPHLEEILGRLATPVRAEWDRSEDEKGQPLYALRISDGTDVATRKFDLDDLRSRHEVRFGLYRFWDDILAARLDRSLRRLEAMSNSED
jgi:hypothetical protein